MIDLLKLEAPEAERIAYAEGFTMAAELFARIADLEAERDALAGELEDLKDAQPDPRQVQQDAQDLEHLKQFFYDCFQRLAGHYPAPSVTSDYDKSVIFAAIERGEGLDANGGAQ
jgi:hypothetical protein